MKGKKCNGFIDRNKLIDVLSKRAEGFFYSEEILEYGEKEEKKKEKSDAVSGEKEKSLTKHVSKNDVFENHELYSDCDDEQNTNIAQKNSADLVQNENQQNLVLLKKKITTHYVPPDLTAVKMLLENFGQEVMGKSVISSMSDEELLKMRNQIISNLKDD